MSKYTDIMKIQDERNRIEKLIEEYPIIEKAEKVAELLEKIKCPYTAKEEIKEISIQLSLLFQ